MDASYSSRSTSSYSNPYLFTGRRLDTLDGGDLKIMYYRARTYDTVTGRFLQRDPLGIDPGGTKSINPFDNKKHYTDGMNLYEYVQSNPVIQNDRLGLECGISRYKNRGLTGHVGILISGNDYDFGPATVNPFWGKGECPWSGGGPGQSYSEGKVKFKKKELKIRKSGWLAGNYNRSMAEKIKPCKCASCNDIVSCIGSLCSAYNSEPFSFPVTTCRTFVSDVKRLCCLAG